MPRRLDLLKVSVEPLAIQVAFPYEGCDSPTILVSRQNTSKARCFTIIKVSTTTASIPLS